MSEREFVQKTLGGRTFWVSDPEKQPHGRNAFDEEEPIFPLWMAEASPGKILVDVGAGWGNYSLPALAAGAMVLGFEPSDEQHEAVKAAVLRNGFAHRAALVRGALFDGGPYPPELAGWVHGEAYPAKGVEYVTLDYAVEELFLGVRVDAVKVDVEGGELGVLRGGERTLRRWRPTLLVEDHAGCNPGHVVSDYPESLGGTGALFALLSSYGYGSLETLSWGVTNPARKYLVARAEGGKVEPG